MWQALVEKECFIYILYDFNVSQVQITFCHEKLKSKKL